MKSWSQVEVPPLHSRYQLSQISLTNSKTGLIQVIPAKSAYRMYVCGITPYDATHLGHAATYLTFDLIGRYLLATGSVVTYVQNITDIDDPLLERAIRDGVDWKELAHSQIDLFTSDMESLRVMPPDSYIGAVEAIPLIIDAIQSLQKHGSIYPINHNYYFSNSPESTFGELSHLSQKEMEEIFSQRGGDPDLPGKLHTLDCLVWMSQREGEPGWPSYLGTGRPGWHIECTAIALEYLHPDPSDSFLIDIQGGGNDLIFPHHEMCRSQAKVLTGKELAANYVHAGMIGLDGEKMSKSKGNLILVSKLVSQGVNPMAIRYALMGHHYRDDQMWSEELLSKASSSFEKLKQACSLTEVHETSDCIRAITSALANDLDTPTVIKLLDNWAGESLRGGTGGDVDDLKTSLDALLGLKF
ncbi:MAG: cysteine--1-D-myo-inosityl 2-amino-2-deoxy-alpha-D-glucopyranoside ligase [Candidatus Planktophila sp.]|nr:cysteine--1-D-myo-inosityl 2-amino-2-deoxy-alpha-D-glucopyranoside ligase [Candidatus Planktophila sp.]